MPRSQVIIGGFRLQGMPTNELSGGELQRIRDFRVEGHSKTMPLVKRNVIERYVDDGMDTWVDANSGVRRRTLRSGQTFARTAVWLAYAKDNSLVGEIMSADNASGGGIGATGSLVRTLKMQLPVLPAIQDNTLLLKHGPYRVVREVFGTPSVLVGLMYMTAAHHTRRDQPMSAYLWEEEKLTGSMEDWGFNLQNTAPVEPLGEQGPMVMEQNWRVTSGKRVAQYIAVITPQLATNLLAVNALRKY